MSSMVVVDRLRFASAIAASPTMKLSGSQESSRAEYARVAGSPSDSSRANISATVAVVSDMSTDAMPGERFRYVMAIDAPFP